MSLCIKRYPSVPARSVLGKESCHLWLGDHFPFLITWTPPSGIQDACPVSKESRRKVLFSHRRSFPPPCSPLWDAHVTGPIPVPFKGRHRSDAGLGAGTEDHRACVEVRL